MECEEGRVESEDQRAEGSGAEGSGGKRSGRKEIGGIARHKSGGWI